MKNNSDVKIAKHYEMITKDCELLAEGIMTDEIAREFETSYIVNFISEVL